MKGYEAKGYYRYKVKFLLQAMKEVDFDIEGKDLDIDSAKKLAQEKAEALVARLGNNFKVVGCVEAIGKKEK